MKKKSLTVNKNKFRKLKRQIQIKIFNIATQVIYPVVFNDFVY